MPDTLVTPDGKMHTILGSTTLERIIREYAGDQAAAMVEKLTGRTIYEEARAETDLGVYEQSLEHWHRMAQDWLDALQSIIDCLTGTTGAAAKTHAADMLTRLKTSIEAEL